jgi:hypothetical protein
MIVGVMRKTESRIQRTFEGVFGRTFKGHAQPVELAQKLIKEMEEGKVLTTSRSYAPNHFTVYLCRKDRDYFRPQEAVLIKELETYLLQHARSEGYHLVGPPEVALATDEDLKLGFFGIRAEPVSPRASRPADAGAARVPSSASPIPPSPIPASSAAVGAAGLAASSARQGGTGNGLAGWPSSDETQGISASQARELSLARRSLTLSDGQNRREFQKGRIVIGRAREADFQVDDPNVSRQHATLYWEGDQVFVKDMGSTNGTFINGRPVTTGPIGSGDVITLGSSKISVRIS